MPAQETMFVSVSLAFRLVQVTDDGEGGAGGRPFTGRQHAGQVADRSLMRLEPSDHVLDLLVHRHAGAGTHHPGVPSRYRWMRGTAAALHHHLVRFQPDDR